MDEFEQFKKWARENRVNLEHSDDYEQWWACWEDGYKTAEKKILDAQEQIRNK